MTKVWLAVAPAIAALAISCGGSDLGAGVAEPDSTPPPDWGRPSDAEEPVIEGDVIDLSKPLAHPFSLTIGDRTFLIPAGATVVSVIEGPPVVDVETGERIGDPIAHPHYSLISRNGSSVKIDDETGDIFEWNVRPGDREDFEPLRHPTHLSDASLRGLPIVVAVAGVAALLIAVPRFRRRIRGITVP